MSESYTSADLAAVRRSIARGEKSVQFGDRLITYRSMSELFDAEKRILAFLSESNGRPRQFFGAASKGFD